jgi:serine/threonine-protein kinase HipA
MKCLGCYSEVNAGYCLPCRKKLFDKVRVSATLNFDAPKADNLAAFQEHSKRMSISGVQLKYSLRLQNGLLELTDKNAQYILKPIPPSKQLVNVEAVPQNEHLTMQIAEQVFKIRTAANALIYFKDGEPAYITKRFDVTSNGQKILQEDFAQLSNRTKATHGETFKYDGTYEEIGRLIKKFVAASVPALEKFFQLVVFNYVFSNGDAHLKNFSLYTNDNREYELTPAYDLMSTVIHTPHESDTALDLYEGDIQSEYYSTYGHHGRDNFLELAKRLELVQRRAERIIDEFEAKKDQVILFVDGSFLSEDVKKLYKDNLQDKLTRLHV